MTCRYRLPPPISALDETGRKPAPKKRSHEEITCSTFHKSPRYMRGEFGSAGQFCVVFPANSDSRSKRWMIIWSHVTDMCSFCRHRRPGQMAWFCLTKCKYRHLPEDAPSDILRCTEFSSTTDLRRGSHKHRWAHDGQHDIDSSTDCCPLKRLKTTISMKNRSASVKINRSIIGRVASSWKPVPFALRCWRSLSRNGGKKCAKRLTVLQFQRKQFVSYQHRRSAVGRPTIFFFFRRDRDHNL